MAFRGLLFSLFMIYTNISEAIKPFLTDQPLSIGNFSLATSQQPGPFFSFGQNIIDKNQFIVSYTPGYIYSLNQSIIDGTPSLLYGITDSASLLLTIPYAFSYKNGKQNMSGIGDLELDLEYAFLGIGRNIKSVEKKYIFLGLFEVNGQSTEKTKLNTQNLPNTGGTIIYATPSLWFSTPKLIVQIGISLPINQFWYGNQSNISYYANSIITWTIH